MSNTNGASGPIVQNSITTLPTAPAKAAQESAPETLNAGETATESVPKAAGEAAPPAPAASGTDSAVDPPKEVEPDKHLELAKRFEAAAKREANVRRLEAQWQERISAAKEKEKQLEAKLSELEDALGDPVGHMLKIGKDPVEVAKRFAKPETEEEKRIRKLEEALSAKEAREREIQERTEAQHSEERKMFAMRTFVGSITPDNAPNLTLVYEPSEVPALVESLLFRQVDDGSGGRVSLIQKFNYEHGRNPTDDEIREALEQEAAPRATKILEAHRARVPAASQPSNPAQPGPNGISNQHAAVTTSGKPKKLSLEERRRAARQEIVQGLETGDTE